MEIEMFFAKYDTDGSRLLEQDEVKKMLADLEGQKVELESKLTGLNWHSSFIWMVSY